MRIIVVEDEPRTRRGLIDIINKYTKYEVVGSETDGIKGLELISRLDPDLVISDINMPNKNGLEMIKDIRQKGLKTEIILLTGYSEFEYAKQAIQLQVDEYLLKPLDVDDIIQALDKIEKKIRMKKLKRPNPEQILFSLLHNKLAVEKSNKWVGQLKQALSVFKEQEYLLYLIQPLNQMTKKDEDVRNNIRMIMGELEVENFVLMTMPMSHRIVFIQPIEKNKVYAKEQFETTVVNKIIKEVDTFIVSKTVNNLIRIRDDILELNKKFDYVFDLKSDQIWEKEKIKKLSYHKLSYPKQLEILLKKAICDGENEKTNKYIIQFEEEIICSKTEPMKRKEYTARFLLNLLEWQRDFCKEREYEQSYQLILNSILDIQSRDILTYQFFKIANNLFVSKADNKTDNGLILLAVEYIRVNYHQDISLVATAGKIGVTPEYLSKLFKQEMGINFTTFITQFRISQSKRLMLETDKKMYEISKAVGYNDTKYYNKVFKSLNGVSPTEFRRQKR